MSLSIGVPGGDVDRLSAIFAILIEVRSMKVAFYGKGEKEEVIESLGIARW